MWQMLKRLSWYALLCLLSIYSLQVNAQQSSAEFIKVSTSNPRYFSTTSGKFWMPVELNYAINIYTPPAAIFANAEAIFKTFAVHGGNAVRIWGPTPFLEVENKQIGSYDDRLLYEDRKSVVE